jgi:hypothetical protein
MQPNTAIPECQKFTEAERYTVGAGKVYVNKLNLG